MAQLINGKEISSQIKEEVKAQVAKLAEEGTSVCLAVIQVGDDPASSVYVRNKKKACEYVGIKSLSYELPESTTEEELIALVHELNERRDVNGFSCSFRCRSTWMKMMCFWPSIRRRMWTASIPRA